MAECHCTYPYPETWKAVVGYEGIYEVSNHGQVRSLPRIDMSGNNRLGKMRKLEIDKDGYNKIVLRLDGVSRKFLVHRLVLEAFVGPCPENMEACHNNGMPGDNHVPNLRWDTNEANKADIIRHGRNFNLNKTHCVNGHPYAGENLRPSDWEKGNRACLACDRARGYIKYRPHLRNDYKRIADWQYKRLMREGRVAT